jgi:hypothetical protein
MSEKKIPIIINNRNLLEWPKKMVEVCKTFESVGDIIIIDNGSSYEPLLEWYRTLPCEIIYSENGGNISPWVLKIPEKYNFDYYVVTDPDLDLSETPKDCLLFLRERMERYEKYGYIGLSLSNFQQPINNPYHYHLKTWAHHNWINSPLQDGLLLNQIVDTTFAIYKSNRNHRGESCATNYPYSAKHIPWNFTNDELNNIKNFNYEFYYYLMEAGESCSYKRFVGFENRIYE